MEIKHSQLKFSYKIEERPGGGFIARPSDPSMPSFEGATMEEVKKQVQAKITEFIGTAFPQLTTLLHTSGADVKAATEYKLITTKAGDAEKLASTPGVASLVAGPVTTERANPLNNVWKVVAVLAVLWVVLYWWMHH